MPAVRILFTRFSAFYAPLIATMAGGFLSEEGLDYEWTRLPRGGSAAVALQENAADVAQATPSVSFLALSRGQALEFRHFAQINRKDGFFIAGRHSDPHFQWSKLEGARVLVDHGLQPLTMFRHACLKAGIDCGKVKVVDAGNPAEMELAFRAGEGDYIHLQGPAPQALEYDGAGYVVAEVGRLTGEGTFSSLAALPAWLATDEARAFTRAYRRASAWITQASPDEIAAGLRSYFPDFHVSSLAACIAAYQGLGNWTPRAEIAEQDLDATQDLFIQAGYIKERCAYDMICAAPPA